MGDEDVACADYMAALLRNEEPDPAAYLARVRRSTVGRRFGDPAWPDFPPEDLPCCTALDRFDFAMPVYRESNRHVMVAVKAEDTAVGA